MGFEMTEPLVALVSLAALTGLIHTLAGPDHYLPFVAMSRSRGWSWAKTTWITVLCGMGHVLSSVALGGLGIAAGVAVSRLESLESARGTMAAWLMIGFGLVYATWGMRRAWRGKSHTHTHAHATGALHVHEHTHERGHVHVHDGKSAVSITPWVLFTLFVFGPCEVLIPLLMVPAAEESLGGLLLVTAVFAIVTISTMVAVVSALGFGFRAIRFGWLERNTHALAGCTIALCGGLMLVGF